MYLLGQYCSSKIEVNENARRAFELLRTQRRYMGVSKYLVLANLLTLTLLNMQSLKSHVIDLINDQGSLVNDLLCLTETQVQREDNAINTEAELGSSIMYLSTQIIINTGVLHYVQQKMSH